MTQKIGVELSGIDRLMLINQFLILALLDKENADEHSRRAKILEEGYVGEYHDVFSRIGDELSCEECQEVTDTLCMYSELQRAHETAPDKISAEEVRFPGYGGDDERRQRSYCKFRAQDLDNFSVAAGNPYFLAHMPYSDVYRRMLTAWRATDPTNRAHLTAEQARAILNAGQLDSRK